MGKWECNDQFNRSKQYIRGEKIQFLYGNLDDRSESFYKGLKVEIFFWPVVYFSSGARQYKDHQVNSISIDFNLF